MNAFDKVIGYDAIKKEFMQICDMVHNKEVYEKLGAKFPRGILLHGAPGLGKTLLAKCFIEESGLTTYTIRRKKATNYFIGDITSTFHRAKANAPCIVFLDDMDKFANEDFNCRDAEEYVAVQAGIDEVKDSEVFVIGTANDIDKLPDSLIRLGRFDRKIEVSAPSRSDASEIVKYYLKDKEIADDLNIDDVAKMISYSSCAELETILNEAAISAAYERKEKIAIEDIVNAVIRSEYEAPDSFAEIPKEDAEKMALHEAGHAVISEVLCPGSVGIVSLRKRGGTHSGGFMRRCKDLTRRSQEILVSLGGKAAVELYYSEACASGCQSDISRAFGRIREGIMENATCGLGGVDVAMWHIKMSENMNARNEALVHAELERYMLKAKDILLKNREFLEEVAKSLMEKEVLLYSDIQKLKSKMNIVNVEI